MSYRSDILLRKKKKCPNLASPRNVGSIQSTKDYYRIVLPTVTICSKFNRPFVALSIFTLIVEKWTSNTEN